jgi:type VI secretion system secreted protein Hcp
MAFDSFLKLGKLKGESVVKGFEDQIQISSWSWGVSQTGTTHTGTGGGAGKADVSDLQISHKLDAASPNLIVACCTGEHFDTATLTMRKAGGDALDFLLIELKDIIVTSVMPAASSSDEVPSETFCLNFASFKFTYQPQDSKGAKKGGAIVGSFNIATNVKS